jgi:hypothetical protein
MGRVREVVQPTLRSWGFRGDLARRRRKYADQRLPFSPREDIAREIETNGYVVLRRFLDPALLLSLRDELEAHLDRGTDLMPVTDDAARVAGDLGPARALIPAEDLRRGQDHFRLRTNYASVADPLVNTRTTPQIAFRHDLLDIAQSYLGAPPAIGGLNLRKSFRNDLPAFDTLHFHVDPDSPKFL